MIEKGDLPDGDELLELFQISREPMMMMKPYERSGSSSPTSASNTVKGSAMTFDKVVKKLQNLNETE